MTSAYEGGQVPQIEVRHRLRIAREHAGLEQDELADLIGVSRGTIGNAEKGRVQPRKIVVNAWAMACGVPASWIWTGKPPTDGPGPTSGLGIICPKDEVKLSKRSA
jgi:DNA-binding XRE family transcriptional regulator